MLSNNGRRGIVKEIVEIIRTNGYQKVKWKCGLNNKLIIFIYYLKLFFTLNHTIKLYLLNIFNSFNDLN